MAHRPQLLQVALSFVGILVLTALCSIGCRPTDERDVVAPSPTVNVHSSADGEPSDLSVDSIGVSVIDRAGYDRFIADQRGQVVLVDFWATWCPPCVEGFPHTVQLGEKYKPQGLVVASLALEAPSDAETVLNFLRQHSADLPNFISAYGGADAQSADQFDLQSGTIPTLKLYDRSGVLRETFGDGESFTFEAIEVAIRQLLVEAP